MEACGQFTDSQLVSNPVRRVDASFATGSSLSLRRRPHRVVHRGYVGGRRPADRCGVAAPGHCFQKPSRTYGSFTSSKLGLVDQLPRDRTLADRVDERIAVEVDLVRQHVMVLMGDVGVDVPRARVGSSQRPSRGPACSGVRPAYLPSAYAVMIDTPKAEAAKAANFWSAALGVMEGGELWCWWKRLSIDAESR